MLGIFGRNDGDPDGLKAHAAAGMGTELYESPHSFDVSGSRILLVHDLGEVNKRSIDAHDIVVHGLTHREEIVKRGNHFSSILAKHAAGSPGAALRRCSISTRAKSRY